VELLPELHEVAEANLRKLPGNRECSRFECLCMDASGYVFPPEPAVVYLFNPFPEGVFERVMANLGRSLAELPRELYIVYHNPLLERVVARSEAFRKIGGTHQYVVYKAKG